VEIFIITADKYKNFASTEILIPELELACAPYSIPFILLCGKTRVENLKFFTKR